MRSGPRRGRVSSILRGAARYGTWLVCVAACLSACTAAARAPQGLAPCGIDGPPDALCGTVTVFENRAAGGGRRLALRVVVLPALRPDAEPDPFVFLAGGPGQGAAQLAPLVRTLFARVQRDRDILLVDQRGTGQSHPLDCAPSAHTLAALFESDAEATTRLRRCLASWDADVRHYTTDVAMDDLDEVRARLGYDRLNLYGGSYGTRAALVYLRRHERHVRSVVLDGVAPPDMRLPLHAGRDAQRALDRLAAACEADASCTAHYPDLARRVARLIARLEAAPVRTTLAHPVTGVREAVSIDGRAVATALVTALYSPMTAALVPALVARAEQDDYQGWLALALAAGHDDGISAGMQLAVICSEDVSRLTAAEISAARDTSLFRDYFLRGPVEACAHWPRASMPETYYAPVVSAVPVLLLSGELDPVTPPVWAASVARHLTRSRLVTLPATGHGVAATPCGARLVRQFLADGDADVLDTTCTAAPRRPPFVVTPAGPDPLAPDGGRQ